MVNGGVGWSDGWVYTSKGKSMTWNTMILSEPDSAHAGFMRRYYATIDVAMSGTYWLWRQVDAHGNYVGTVSAQFSTEAEALQDALSQLGGDRWE